MRGYISKTYNWETPDGEDCMKKTVHSAKLAAYLAAMVGIYDVWGITKPPDLLSKMGRMATVYMGPAAGAGAAYASTVCIVAQIRGKDGPLNHAFGGMVAGSVFGVVFRRGLAGLFLASVFAAGGYGMKVAKEVGFEFAPQVKKEYGSLRYPGRLWGDEPNILKPEAVAFPRGA